MFACQIDLAHQWLKKWSKTQKNYDSNYDINNINFHIKKLLRVTIRPWLLSLSFPSD